MQAGAGRDGGEGGGPLICVGEALVDLICPDPLDDPAEASRFEVHFGGALANVAVAARRAGAAAELAGGCGDDEWGRYLRERLTAEGVGLAFHALVPGAPTPYAFATLDRQAEPAFRVQADGIEQGIATLAGREEELVEAAGAIVVGSNTLPGEGSREITFDVCRAAARAGTPVVFDPNLRPGRWADLDLARATEPRPGGLGCRAQVQLAGGPVAGRPRSRRGSGRRGGVSARARGPSSS